MYVTPRPLVAEDPLYAVRLGLAGALAYAAIPILDPALPPVVAALPVGLIAAQRKAFVPARVFGAAGVLIVLVVVMAWVVKELRPLPLVYVGAMWLIFFLSFRMILRTGAPFGMLLIIVAVLMSVMGMHGTATVDAMRDGFVQAALVTAVVGPLVYLVLPARTQERQVDDPVPTTGNLEIGAAIRATVLLALSFWLYSVMQPSDMMMAMVAAMVIVFPTRHAVWWEARQRVRATAYGTGVAFAVLWVFTIVSHLFMVLGLLFLAGLFFGTLMLNGRHPSMVYQYAFSVTLSLVAGALSTQDPGYAGFTRLVLTLGGAFAAAFGVALLDSLTHWYGPRRAAPPAEGRVGAT